MTTLHLARPLLPLRAKQQPVPALWRSPAAWLVRLAAWAERQPRHRHLGSWTAV